MESRNEIYYNSSKIDGKKNGSIIALLLLFGIIIYIFYDNYRNIRIVDACYLVCDRCDLAIWRALEMKLEDPGLFEKDKLFSMQYPLFPTFFSRCMNILHQVTGNVEISYFIGNILLSSLFICGVFVLTQRMSGNYYITVVVVLLSAFSRRLSIYGDGWGFPLLKPMEIVGAATPWLFWFLFRSLDKSFPLEYFGAIATLLVYVHPPTALILLCVGFTIYAIILYGEKGHLKRITRAVVLVLVILAPFLYSKMQAAVDIGPPLHLLLDRVGYALFPSRETITNAICYLLFPMIVSIIIYLKVHIHLNKLSKKFLLALFISGLAVTFLGSFSYLWTGLSKFALPSSSRYLYFPIYFILALGILNVKTFRITPRIVYILCFAIILLQIDTKIILARENYINNIASKTVINQCEYAELGDWARVSTPRDAVFLVPPHIMDAGFRILSNRAVVVINKDGGNAKYSGTIAKEWYTRMQDVLAGYRDGRLSTLKGIAKKYDAQFVIVPRFSYSKLDGAVFTNQEWIVWSVTEM